ncbi:hypothetical protein A2619_02330 [candidate division WWE3 bacterium RIFOXYD1_FULL_39_9]|uniref:Uncharacterized protein n=1 Tax=candidate division WWE3 bacterium RIFOXYD1_FULL_39_9 TaxID=1802649 RepID=A0A1F4X3K3_UNCKA|nr:MAG: hypothetical protein A2619_02330 [candidate division WWE3 bacterium RIFOXYD1_FULL_39_9]
MTREEIEQTEWAKELKEKSSYFYEEAIQYALKRNLNVHISQTNETGETLWAIFVVDNYDFWMDAKKTKKEAVRLCRQMKWKIS